MTYCPPIAGSQIPSDWFSCAWGGSWGFWINGTYVGQGPISLAVSVFLVFGLALLLLIRWREGTP